MEMLILENRATGKRVKHPVSSEDFDAMEKKGRGLKLFKIVDRIKAAPVVRPQAERAKAVEVPPEVQVIKAKKKGASDARASEKPEQDA